jgi:NADPH:quinone reductase
MRAYALEEFGQAGDIHDLPTPEPSEAQVLVEVQAAGVNPIDGVVTQGWIKDMMEHRFPLIAGIDAAGVVAAVGAGVSDLAVGDAVFGSPGKMYWGEGTFAEFATMGTGALARRPDALDPIVAAAAPLASMAAVSFMESIDPTADQTILVNGAAGGVGSFLVQLASQRGARVIGVCRAINEEYVRGLGAADVIDYEAEDLAAALRARYPDGVDAVADLVADQETVARLSGQVKPGGWIGSSGMVDVQGLLKPGVTGGNIMANVTGDRLDTIAESLVSGALKPPQIATVPLEKAGDAIAQVGARHVRGKLVVTMT